MLPLKTSRRVFAAYVLVMALAAVCAFGNLSGHLFSTHDFQYFPDPESVSATPSPPPQTPACEGLPTLAAASRHSNRLRQSLRHA